MTGQLVDFDGHARGICVCDVCGTTVPHGVAGLVDHYTKKHRDDPRPDATVLEWRPREHRT